MLKQPSNKRCVWIVFTLFSAIAATGNGLHFLPGLGHDCRETHLPPAAHGESRGVDCTGTHAFNQTSGCEGRPAVAIAANHDECPVCQYFTKAKTVPQTVAFEIESRVVEGRIPSIRSLLLARPLGAYFSRAPPSLG
ncbi:MAG: hypothetical protein IT426_11845 [Pirellulales bacterium]|nr:hypothetical protein [Pirellulales bacterium]